MNNLNSILIEGNLTKDPQEKSIEGNALSSFSIACNRYYKKDGEQVQETSFFNVHHSILIFSLLDSDVSEVFLLFFEGKKSTCSPIILTA
jgi:hypothetical protein